MFLFDVCWVGLGWARKKSIIKARELLLGLSNKEEVTRIYRCSDNAALQINTLTWRLPDFNATELGGKTDLTRYCRPKKPSCLKQFEHSQQFAAGKADPFEVPRFKSKMAGYPPGPGAPPYPTNIGGGGYPPGPGYPTGPQQGGYPQSAPQPQMQQQKIPASKVELYISCTDLLRMDVTSASDPIAILHLYDKPTKKWNEVICMVIG